MKQMLVIEPVNAPRKRKPLKEWMQKRRPNLWDILAGLPN
jgi:hypothetical protein